MTKEDVLNDITIAFSGYNIKDFAVLAIESFLLLNPDMRENIVYFDDESTDGTREELESRGIKVITWLPEIIKERDNYFGDLNSIFNGRRPGTPARVSFINKCIRKQINTRFLYMSDADMVFVRNYFIKIISLYLSSNADIVCSILTENLRELKKDKSFEANLYEKYLKDKKLKKTLIYEINEKGEISLVIKRLYLNQALVDLKNFEKKCSFEDDISCENFSFFKDTGSSLWEKSILNKVKIKDTKEIDRIDGKNSIIFFNENSDVIHLRWISSAIREKRNKNRAIYKEEMDSIIGMKKLLNNKNIKPIFEKIGIDFREIISNFEEKVKNAL